MPVSANLKAAQEVLRSRAAATTARNAASTSKKPMSIRAATALYKGSSPAAVHRLIRKIESDDIPAQPGRPRALTDDEDEALVAFVVRMQSTGFPATKAEIEDAANSFRKHRDPDAAPVSKMWYSRWRDDHPELQKTYLKAVESSRNAWELGGITDVNDFFNRLEHAVRTFRIGGSEFWNEDEGGIRIGMLRDRIQCLVVRTKRLTRLQTVDPANRESCTLIGTGNAVGDTIPPWIIFKTFPTLDFSDIDADPEMRFAQSESAFNNSEIFLEWARHFNRHSWSKSATAQKRGVTLEEWFGCDEHFRDPLLKHVQYDAPPIEHTEEDRIYRLLLLDGFTGHGSFALREYCVKFNIIIAPLPPHSTHIMQPMDVGVFQFLKEAHQKKLRYALRKGAISFSRLEFVKGLQDIFDAGFTKHNIISGFTKSGIWPVDRTPVIAYMQQKKMKARQAINPAFASLLPDDARFQRASDVTKHMSEKYSHLLSSPTRGELRQVRKVVTEALLLHETVQAYIDDRISRLEKAYHQKRKGKRVKPLGDFSQSVSLAEIRQQQEDYIAEREEKEIKSQIRNTRKFVIQEMDKIKAQWRSDKQGLQFKQWLRHTGKDVEYWSMDENRARMAKSLSQKEDFFMIDTELTPEVRESVRNANYAPKPLNAVDWGARSDDDVEITVNAAHNSEEEEGDDDEEELRFLPMPQIDENGMLPPWAHSPPPRESSLRAHTPCPIQWPPQHLQTLVGKVAIFQDPQDQISLHEGPPQESRGNAGPVEWGGRPSPRKATLEEPVADTIFIS